MAATTRRTVNVGPAPRVEGLSARPYYVIDVTTLLSVARRNGWGRQCLSRQEAQEVAEECANLGHKVAVLVDAEPVDEPYERIRRRQREASTRVRTGACP